MKAAVAYEAPKRKEPLTLLKWHRSKWKGVITALGAKGNYVIEAQKPNRRVGVFKWCLTIAGQPALLNGQPMSLDDREELKRAAAVYDAMPAGVPVAVVASEASDRYKKEVRDKLVALGSPSPDEEIANAAKYLEGMERAGISPDVAAAVVTGTLHHGHPKHAAFAEASEAAEDRLTQEERESLPKSMFALPDRRELLIDTPNRTRNAPARLEMMHNRGDVTRAEYSQARHRILAASHHFGIESRYEAFEESPTREEWEVIVTNAPAAHRGAILAMGLGEVQEVGNKIILRGFYDDEQASRTAGAIARTYKVGVTFGPRNALYEAAEARRRPEALDEHAATELELYADNTSEIYAQKTAILANLKKKLQKGTYDPELARKLWMYWVDAAAKRYAKEFGGVWNEMFPIEVRREVARREEERERAEMQLQARPAKETNGVAHNPLV